MVHLVFRQRKKTVAVKEERSSNAQGIQME